MVLFEKLFKSRSRTQKWQDAEPDVREQALQGFSSDEERLAFIANEPLPRLRSQAVALLTGSDALESLLHSKQDEVRQQARERLLERLLPAGGDLSAVSDPHTLVRIAGLTSDNELRIRAISGITDEQQRLNIAMEHPVARVRLTAAEGIHDGGYLQTLLDHAQGKDKALYRLAKERLAQYKAAQQADTARREAVDQLLAQARYLNKVGYHPEFNGKYQLLSKQWPDMQADADADTAAAINAELQAAGAILQAHAEEEARIAEQQAEAAAAAERQSALLDELQQLSDQSTDQSSGHLQEQLKQLEARWDEAFRQHNPGAEQARQFENQLQGLFALQSALQKSGELQDKVQQTLAQPLADDLKQLNKARKQADQWLKAINWPTAHSAPAWLNQLKQRQQDAADAIAALQQQQHSRLAVVEEQLTALETALNDGHLKDASRLNSKIQHGLRQLDDKTAMQPQRRLRALQARLQEMRDWAGFATAPKKEQLVESMEALINASIAPDLLAEKIHDLQEEWKSLGTAAGDNALWERFQAAGDQAFEPCRAYFAEVAQQREKNIALRDELIAELSTYEASMNWEEADWKTVQKTLDAARETFRHYSPVERNEHKRTQDEFRAVCDRIYAHLKDEYDRNVARKQALVDEAEAVSQAEDLSGAVDQVKALQARWKEVGVMPRSADQKLWKAFRKHCDHVFERLNENREARKAELNETVGEAEALTEKARALLQSDATLADIRQQLADIRSEFSAIQLPRNAHQRLQKALNQIDDDLKARAEEDKKREEQARWQGLLSRIDNLSADDAAWEAACTQALPQGYDEAEFTRHRSGERSAEDNATDICIQMETLADVESPAADKSRRMELQVQRLAEGLGKGMTPQQERRQLVSRWLTVDADDTLKARFVNALKASL